MASLRHLLRILLVACALLGAGGTRAQLESRSILLVATHAMTAGSFFHRTVVLVTRHGSSPPVGVIINRPTTVPLQKLFPKLPEAEAQRPIHVGGPVQTDQLTFLYRSAQGSADAIPISPTVHLGRSGVTLRNLLRGELPHQGLKVFAGYSGWAPGQLEWEIHRGSWYVLPVDEKFVFDQPADHIWPELHRRASITRT